MLNVKMASAVKIGKHLKELRFHLCQTSTASQGIRDFINENYVTLKKANPKFPFLVRECANVPPKVYARYAFGKESSLPLNNMSKDQVARAVETLIAKK